MSVNDCPCVEQLRGFLDGRIDEASSDAVASHLETCVFCQDTIVEIERQPADELLCDLRSFQAASELISQSLVREAVRSIRDSESAAIFREAAESRARFTDVRSLAGNFPETIGNYRIVECIGSGGMGTVFRARHTQLDKDVALKLIPLAATDSERASARFRREALALGQLDHPHLVRATDAGCERDYQYIVMDLIPGLNLSELVHRNGPLAAPDACEIIRQVALGLDHAHSRQLVHRDVKPSNIILAPDGLVRVLDLGLVKLRERKAGDLTSHDRIMGTLDYMSPEQGSDSGGVDHRSDIYSLGCTLFFLLTGRPPFHQFGSESPVAKLMAHVRQPAPRLSDCRSDVPAEVDAVLDRMLAKQPEDRIASAAEVARLLEPHCQGADLRQLLSRGELANLESESAAIPTAQTTRLSAPGGSDTAGMDDGVGVNRSSATVLKHCDSPSSTACRVRAGRRTALRYPAIALSLLGVLVLLGLLVITTGDGELQLYLKEQDVTILLDGNELTEVVVGSEDAIPLRVRVGAGQHQLQVTRGSDTLFVRDFRLFRNGVEVVRAEWKPSAKHELPAKRGAAAAAAGVLPVQPAATSRRPELPAESVKVESSAHESDFPDSDIGNLEVKPGGAITPLALVQRPAPLPGALSWTIESKWPRHGITTVKYSPDGEFIAVGGYDGAVRLVSSSDGNLYRMFLGHSSAVQTIAWSPDGKSVASGGSDRSLVVWSIDSGKALARLGRQRDEVTAAAWSPDGTRLAAGTGTAVLLWNVPEPAVADAIDAGYPVSSLDWHPAGQRLAIGTNAGAVRFWNPGLAQSPPALKRHSDDVRSVVWSHDGTMLASGSSDGTIVIWNGETGLPVKTLANDPRQGRVLCAGWSPDGTQIASAGTSGQVLLRGITDGQIAATLNAGDLDRGNHCALDWSPDGSTLVVASDRGGLQWWSPVTGARVRSIAGGVLELTDAAWSPRTGILAVTAADGVLLLWSPSSDLAARSVSLGRKGTQAAVDWSPDGTTLATSLDQTVEIRDELGIVIGLPEQIPNWGSVRSLACSPDGKSLALAAPRGCVLVDQKTGKTLATFSTGDQGVATIDWSPDARFLLVTDASPAVQVLDVAAGQVTRFMANGAFNVSRAVWSPDAETFAVLSRDGMLSIRARSDSVLKSISLGNARARNYVGALAWSKDASRIAVTIGDAHQSADLFLVDPVACRAVQRFRGHSSAATRVTWSADSRRVASSSADGTLRIWDARSGHGSTLLLVPRGSPPMAIAASGHYRTQGRFDDSCVYVVQTATSQQTLTAAEFASQFTWANDPSRVRVESQ